MTSTYRNALPQLGATKFLTDGGLETVLIFQRNLELPEFAAFDLLKSFGGRQELSRYFHPYIAIARYHQMGFVLESPTWRANPDWASKLGYGADQLDQINRLSIHLMSELRVQFGTSRTPMVISGCVGPRDDGYNPHSFMTPEEARDYHSEQVASFAETKADMVTGMTITYAEEAIGLARAARDANMPVVISFTVETDGNLPSGQPLADAIAQVDSEIVREPAYYMVNCAHPTHFAHILDHQEPAIKRIRGLRANASCKSHAELDEMTELDDGHPDKLGHQYKDLLRHQPQITVLGGCCGTDHRHIAAIAHACADEPMPAQAA